MFNKCFMVLSLTTLFFSSTPKADDKELAEQIFTNLYECMKNIQLDDDKYKGISSQQVLLVSVLKNITNDKTKIKDLGFDIDHSKLFKLVKSSCSSELTEVEKLSSKKTG